MPKGTKANTPERIQRAYDLRKQGLTWEDIGAQLKISAETAKNYANRCENAGQEKLKEFRAATPEVVNPEKTSEIIDRAMTERGLDTAKFIELAQAAGLPTKVALGLANRVRANYGAIYKEVKRLKSEEMIDRLNEKIGMGLKYLDDYAFANASGKDIAIIIGILTEKMLLLGGKPTQIIDVSTSSKLEILMPQFMAEAVRRGITLDVVPTGKLIEDAAA